MIAIVALVVDSPFRQNPTEGRYDLWQISSARHAETVHAGFLIDPDAVQVSQMFASRLEIIDGYQRVRVHSDGEFGGIGHLPCPLLLAKSQSASFEPGNSLSLIPTQQMVHGEAGKQ